MADIKIGILGAGSFARCFTPLFQAHPQVRGLALCDRIPERLEEEAKSAGITETYPDIDDLLASDCDAIAIFTQRDTHAPFAMKALRAGKHVYSAVPAGVTVEEITELEKAVRETGLTYMLGETSYYYPTAIFCRTMWRRGAFGRFVFGEGEYLHDMEQGFYHAYKHSGGENWRWAAGVPPMLYPTHSASMIVSVTGAHMTRVSCLGYEDKHSDGVFRKGANKWDNVFSNETALFRTSDGGSVRLNEFRRVALIAHERLSMFGTDGSFEEHTDNQVWVNSKLEVHDLTDLLKCAPAQKEHNDNEPLGTQEDFHPGVSKVHPTWRLPNAFRDLPNGHQGSHQFLVDDFVRACVTGALPPNHIWAAARYNLPGIIAHESAKQEGELMDVPDLGGPPPEATLLEDLIEKEGPTEPDWSLPEPSRVGVRWWENL